jgi:polyisoprenoid-binding protein YceI
MATATLQTLNIDKAHSEVIFTVRHLITKVRGRFDDFEGVITFSETAPEQSSVRFSIRTESVDTNVGDRDAHLRSADFFDVANHPTINFASTEVKRLNGTTWQIVGTLSIRGVDKVVVVPLTFLGWAKDPWGNQRAGFEAEVALNRRDFGLNWNAALEAGGFLVGDEVKVNLSIQAVLAA